MIERLSTWLRALLVAFVIALCASYDLQSHSCYPVAASVSTSEAGSKERQWIRSGSALQRLYCSRSSTEIAARLHTWSGEGASRSRRLEWRKAAAGGRWLVRSPAAVGHPAEL